MKAYRSMKDEPNFMAMPGTYMGSHYRPEVGGNPNGLEAVTVGRVRGRDNAVVSERHMLDSTQMSPKSYDSPLGPMHHARRRRSHCVWRARGCITQQGANASADRGRALRLQARARAPFRGLLLGVKAGVRGVCGADSMRPRFDGVGFGGGEFLLRLRLVVLRERERERESGDVSVAAAACCVWLCCLLRYLRLRLRLSRQARLLSIAACASPLAADEARLRSGLKEVTRPSVSSASRTS